MKKLLQLTSILLIICSFTACSKQSGIHTIPVTDSDILQSIDRTVRDGIQTHFDLEIESNEFDYTCFNIEVLSPTDKDVYLPHSTMFQAQSTTESVEGSIVGYNGILSHDDDSILGLMVGIYSEKTPIDYTEDELVAIASSFLIEQELVLESEALTFGSINADASSDYFKVLTFQTEDTLFAVGINTQLGNVMYFEYASLS